MKQVANQMIVYGIDAQTLVAFISKVERMLEEKGKVNQPDVPKRENLLTREEVADFLKISLPTLHDWTNRGILRSYTIGRKVRYKETEIINAITPKQRYSKQNAKPF